MAELKDSGNRTDFGTGAFREILDEKGRCDLLPLDLIAERTHDYIIKCIADYIRTGDVDLLWSAIDQFVTNTTENFWLSMIEVSKQFADGAKKYAERNWELGVPLHSYIDSGSRHYMQYRAGLNNEPHDRAFLWNMICAIWTHKNHPNLIDLPFNKTKTTINLPTLADKGISNVIATAITTKQGPIVIDKGNGYCDIVIQRKYSCVGCKHFLEYYENDMCYKCENYDKWEQE